MTGQARTEHGSGWIAGAAVAGLAVALVYLQLTAFGADLGSLATFAALAQMVLAAVALAWLGPAEPLAFWAALAPPLALLALAAAWALLGARLGAPLAPDAAGPELVKLAGVMAMVVVGALIGRRRDRLEVFSMLTASLGVAYVLLCLILARADPLHVWGYPKDGHAWRFTGTLVNANAAGCAFGMIALVSLGAGLSVMRRFHLREAGVLGYVRLIAALGGTLSALAACALTQSRMSLAATLLLGMAMTLGLVGRQWRLRSALIAAAGLAAVLVVTALVLAQIGWRWDTLGADAALRLSAYRHYLTLAAAHPMFGAGLGGFGALNQSTLTPATAPTVWNFGAAHLAALQAAMEGGWPFAALILLAVASLTWPVILDARRQGLGRLASGALAAAALAALCSCVDIALNTPAVCALAALLLGAAFGAAAPIRPSPGKSAGTRAPIRLDAPQVQLDIPRA
jgi:hypothetical protein